MTVQDATESTKRPYTATIVAVPHAHNDQTYHLWEQSPGATVFRILRNVDHWYEGTIKATWTSRQLAHWYGEKRQRDNKRVMVLKCIGPCPIKTCTQKALTNQSHTAKSE